MGTVTWGTHWNCISVIKNNGPVHFFNDYYHCVSLRICLFSIYCNLILLFSLCIHLYLFCLFTRAIHFILCLLVHLVNLFSQLHEFDPFLFYCPLPSKVSDGISIVSRRVFSNRGYIRDALFIPFWYIGWKPRRKFRSRIRMDGSAVCTRDTTPRTKNGVKMWTRFFCHVWVNFVTIDLIARSLSNISLYLVWYWRGYPTSSTRAF